MAGPNLSWGGYKNGQIPRAALVDIGGGKLLEPNAARALAALAAAHEARWGKPVYVAPGQDTYRTLAYQKLMSGTGHHQYVPGTSVHGWARSFDISGYTKTTHPWLVEEAKKYGISWDYGRALGESWHFDYIGPVSGGGAGGSARADDELRRRSEWLG